ncbi:MAG: hypothetical protein NVS2B12_21360 [Ktedonobacteraceae bacterium]
MLYGAYGHTGTLIAEEAVRRGHRPLLAGRSEVSNEVGQSSNYFSLSYVSFAEEYCVDLTMICIEAPGRGVE